MENLTLVAPILTLTDAENVDAISGGHYLQDMFKAQGPFIGSTNQGWMPIVSKAGPDGIAYYRDEDEHEIFETAQKLVAAFNSKPEPFNGDILEAKFNNRHVVWLIFNDYEKDARIDMGNWTKEGINQLILDLETIRDSLSSSVE